MKLYSWPFPVLACKSLCNETERDYHKDCDFKIDIKKISVGDLKGKFRVIANVGSKELSKALQNGNVNLIFFQEALASPLRLARKLDVTNEKEGCFSAILEIDSSKFSGGLQVCAYLVTVKDFKLSTKECVDGYPETIHVFEGSILGYSNAKRIEEDKIKFQDLFVVRGDQIVKGMRVDHSGDRIVVTLSPSVFNSYKVYRGMDGSGKAASIVACSILLPALVEVLSKMINDITDETQNDWSADIKGARSILVSELKKLGISPGDLKQKGASYGSSLLLEQLPFNFDKLFKELDQILNDN